LKSFSIDAVEKNSEEETIPFVLESVRSKTVDKSVESGRSMRHGHSVAIIDADSANSAVSGSGSD
jgi:hypothetical protein